MQYINPTLEQIIEKTRDLSDDELVALRNETHDLDWSHLETQELSRDSTITVSVAYAMLDGEPVENFSMIVTTRFVKNGYVYFSNGSQAFSLRLATNRSHHAGYLALRDRGLLT